MVDQLQRGIPEDDSKRILGAAREGKWEAVGRRLDGVQDVQALTSFRAFAAINYRDQLKDKLPQFLAAVDTRLRALGVIMQIEEPAAPAVVVAQPQARPVAAPALQTPRFAPTPRGPAPMAAPRQPVAPVQQRPAPAPVRPAPMPTRAPVAPAMAAAPVARGPAPAAASKTTVHQEPVRGSREGR
jgi:hypothetical protein